MCIDYILMKNRKLFYIFILDVKNIYVGVINIGFIFFREYLKYDKIKVNVIYIEIYGIKYDNYGKYMIYLY